MKKIFLIAILVIIFSFSLLSASSVGLVENLTWGSNLTGVRFPSISFGDIDNDGDEDMALVGCLTDGGNDCENGVIAKIYTNNGTTFTENQTWQQNLTGVGFGSISFADIDNDGDLDLGLLGCTNSSSLTCTNGIRIAKIYTNNGTSFVENSTWQQNLTGTFNGVFTFADIDNDGKLDLALVGQTVSSYIAKIYINNGTSLVESEQWQSNLTGIFQGEISFGDIDNDGDLDLVLSGDTGSSKISKIYINNGTSLVENSFWSQNLLAVDRGSLVFGDIDNDGDLDLDLIGQIAGDHQRVYLNNGTSLVENQAQGGTFEGLFRGSIAFGDYDNDGDLDLAAMGKEAGRAKIYENNYTFPIHTNFIQDSIAHVNISDDIIQNSLIWKDINNDNNIDLIIVGLDSTTLISKIYINNNTVSNTIPSAPSSGFSSSYSNNQLNLSWGNGSDTETNTSGLYYNLMVGNSTTNHTIVSGVYGGSSNPTAGYFGNMMQRKSINLSVSLSEGTYYWYVQTIDTGLAKSSWSTAQSFTVTADTTKPTLTSISSSSVTSTTATITWTSDESSNSTVYYGTTTATTSTKTSASSVTSHSIALSGLSTSTLYYYNVSSCDSSNNCNTSTQSSFTTSALGSNGGTTTSGGGTTTTPSTTTPSEETAGETTIGETSVSESGEIITWTETFSISSEEVKKGFTKQLGEKQRVSIKVNNESHYVGILNVTEKTVVIQVESTPQEATLRINESERFELNDDDFYDLFVKLNDIVDNQATLTIQEIHEEFFFTKERKSNILFWGIVGFILVLIVVLVLYYLKKYLWERELKKGRKRWQK